MSRDLALRFTHPDMDTGAAGLHLSVSGGLELVDGDDSVRQSILLLLSTRPGERSMRPDYGCDIYRLIFGVNDETTAALAIHYVRQAIARWEPRAEILTIDASPDPDYGYLMISLEYRVRVTQHVDLITFNLAMT